MTSRAPRRTLAAVVLLAFGGGARAERVIADFVLDLSANAGGDEMYATRANGAQLRAPPPDSGGSYRLVAAEPRELCAPPAGSDDVFAGAVVVAARGGCSFEAKLRNAAAGGAALLVVFGSVDAAYANASTSYALVDPCAVDCASGSFSAFAAVDGRAQRASGFREQCASRCASGVCAAAGVLETDTIRAGDKLEVCCLPDELMLMNLGGAMTGRVDAPDVPAVYALRADGERLVAAAMAGARIAAHDRAAMTIDPSILLIWALGVFAVTLATWLATATERHAASLVGPDGTRAKPAGWNAHAGVRADAPASADGEETLELTAMHALAFVLVASVSLVAMFVLLQLGMFWVIRVVQVLFCIGCITAIFQFGTFPLVHALQPRLSSVRLLATDLVGELTMADGLALLLSAGLVVWYYTCRHAAYAWALQDLMALAMCAMFLKTVRLPNVRVAAILLSVFFLYDIFMVFISPLFFTKSVMVEVATAGAGGEARQQLSTDGRTCAHIAGERMPVLFMVPRVDFGGGYAMLGLGDVVMPGLLVCFALRYDCARSAPRFLCGPKPRSGSAAAGCCARGPSYFVIIAAGYAVGLLLALLANVLGLTFNGVRGQPALLYLVPCTLGPLMLAAAWRGELREMWLVEGLDAEEDGGLYAAHGSDGGRRESAEQPWADAAELYSSQAHGHVPDGAAGAQPGGGGGGGATALSSGASSAGVRSREHQGRPLLDP